MFTKVGFAITTDLPPLLGASAIRELAEQLYVTPTKKLGQNFVHDANTVRRIVERAGVTADDHVLEIGPGLGSLTLGLLDAGRRVTAVEIDPLLAEALPTTVRSMRPDRADDLTVINDDALRVPDYGTPDVLVANLPYNVSVPVLLRILELAPTVTRGLVMVQAEVADRLAAGPGSKTYGIPSVKAAWWAQVTRDVTIPRAVFWPVPNVDSALVAFTRHDPPADPSARADVFAAIDAAFAQRRKTLRAALASWAGSAAAAEDRLRAAGIDPSARGETLTVDHFARLALG